VLFAKLYELTCTSKSRLIKTLLRFLSLQRVFSLHGLVREPGHLIILRGHSLQMKKGLIGLVISLNERFESKHDFLVQQSLLTDYFRLSWIKGLHFRLGLLIFFFLKSWTVHLMIGGSRLVVVVVRWELSFRWHHNWERSFLTDCTNMFIPFSGNTLTTNNM